MKSNKAKAEEMIKVIGGFIDSHLVRRNIGNEDGYWETKHYFVRIQQGKYNRKDKFIYFPEGKLQLQFGSKRNWDKWGNSIEYYTTELPKNKEDMDALMEWVIKNIPPESGADGAKVEIKLSGILDEVIRV